MLETLRLVRGAVSERALVSVLHHFHIADGKIYGSNGRVSLEAPFPTISDKPVTVPAVKFQEFVDKCEGDPVLEIKDQKMFIKSKVRTKRLFKLPLSIDQYHLPTTEGERFVIPDPISYIESIRRINPFVSDDATRPWAMSILHRSGFFYATNNIVMARRRSDWTGPSFGLPNFTADELLRIRKDPVAVWIGKSSVSYEFEHGFWLRSVIYDAEWPDYIGTMIPDTSSLPALPGETQNVVEDLVPADPDARLPVIIFDGSAVRTREADMSGEDEIDGNVGSAAFHATPLRLVLAHATHLDVSLYPKPCPWKGPELEGVIIGVRT